MISGQWHISDLDGQPPYHLLEHKAVEHPPFTTYCLLAGAVIAQGEYPWVAVAGRALEDEQLDIAAEHILAHAALEAVCWPDSAVANPSFPTVVV